MTRAKLAGLVLSLAFSTLAPGFPRAAAAALPAATDPEASAPLPRPPDPPAVAPAASESPNPTAPPAGGQAEPAPIGGDAEPAPGAVPDGVPSKARHRLAVAPRVAYRLGEAGRAISPAAGYGVGGTYEWTYARASREVELALGLDFGTDRFATAEQGVSTQSGVATSYGSTRLIIESTFVLTHTVAFPAGPVRPFLTVGAGIGFGDLDSVAELYRPGTLHDRQLLGRVAAGIDVIVSRIWFATLRADYTAVRRTDPLRLSAGGELPVFGDLLDISVGLAYRF